MSSYMETALTVPHIIQATFLYTPNLSILPAISNKCCLSVVFQFW